MNKTPIALLNRILSATLPDDLVCLPVSQAQTLSLLSARELGDPLKASMLKTSVSHALQTLGLFGRRVMIVTNQPDFSVGCLTAAGEDAATSSALA